VVTVSLLPSFRQAGDYRYFLFGCLHYVMVLDLFSKGRKPRHLFALLALIPGLLVVRGLAYEPTVLNFNQAIRFGYPLDHANTAGYIFSMSIPLALAFLAGQVGWRYLIGLISFGLQILGLTLTYSRGAWLGWGVSMLFYGLIAKKYKEILALVLFGVLLVSFVGSLRERTLTMTKPQSDVAINDRVWAMTQSFQIGLENPILGLGYGRNRREAIIRDRLKGTEFENTPYWHSHNTYIELFVGTGIMGLGVFLWLLLDALYRTWKKATHETERTTRLMYFGVTAALIALIVTGLGDVPFYHHETRIYFFYFAGTGSPEFAATATVATLSLFCIEASQSETRKAPMSFLPRLSKDLGQFQKRSQTCGVVRPMPVERLTQIVLFSSWKIKSSLPSPLTSSSSWDKALALPVLNVAVQVLLAFKVTEPSVQSELPLQPTKVEPAAGVAVRVTI
jgi:hypothetical protein